MSRESAYRAEWARLDARKNCRTGYACGDACIPVSKDCRKNARASTGKERIRKIQALAAGGQEGRGLMRLRQGEAAAKLEQLQGDRQQRAQELRAKRQKPAPEPVREPETAPGYGSIHDLKSTGHWSAQKAEARRLNEGGWEEAPGFSRNLSRSQADALAAKLLDEDPTRDVAVHDTGRGLDQRFEVLTRPRLKANFPEAPLDQLLARGQYDTGAELSATYAVHRAVGQTARHSQILNNPTPAARAVYLAKAYGTTDFEAIAREVRSALEYLARNDNRTPLEEVIRPRALAEGRQLLRIAERMQNPRNWPPGVRAMAKPGADQPRDQRRRLEPNKWNKEQPIGKAEIDRSREQQAIAQRRLMLRAEANARKSATYSVGDQPGVFMIRGGRMDLIRDMEGATVFPQTFRNKREALEFATEAAKTSQNLHGKAQGFHRSDEYLVGRDGKNGPWKLVKVRGAVVDEAFASLNPDKRPAAADGSNPTPEQLRQLQELGQGVQAPTGRAAAGRDLESTLRSTLGDMAIADRDVYRRVGEAMDEVQRGINNLADLEGLDRPVGEAPQQLPPATAPGRPPRRRARNAREAGQEAERALREGLQELAGADRDFYRATNEFIQAGGRFIQNYGDLQSQERQLMEAERSTPGGRRALNPGGRSIQLPDNRVVQQAELLNLGDLASDRQLNLVPTYAEQVEVGTPDTMAMPRPRRPRQRRRQARRA